MVREDSACSASWLREEAPRRSRSAARRHGQADLDSGHLQAGSVAACLTQIALVGYLRDRPSPSTLPETGEEPVDHALQRANAPTRMSMVGVTAGLGRTRPRVALQDLGFADQLAAQAPAGEARQAIVALARRRTNVLRATPRDGVLYEGRIAATTRRERRDALHYLVSGRSGSSGS